MKNNNLLSSLKNKEIFVISPHFDDAVLSVGTLLYSLKGTSNVTVINVFSKGHEGPYTLSAKKFLLKCGFRSAQDMYRKRDIEDKEALNNICAKQINLGFTDAIFRTKKEKSLLSIFWAEFNHIYPTYRFHILKKISKSDYVIKPLRKLLKKHISKNSIIFVPLGIGNHVDHVIARKVSEKLFKNVIYYSDFPYNLYSNNLASVPQNYKGIEVKVKKTIKTKQINFYSSQITSLFPNGIIPTHTEHLFVKK